jgi:hypothetical protein
VATFDIMSGILKSAQGASLAGITMKIREISRRGEILRWEIEMLQGGSIICDIDYASKDACEEEIGALRILIDDALVTGKSFSGKTKAIAIRNFG